MMKKLIYIAAALCAGCSGRDAELTDAHTPVHLRPLVREELETLLRRCPNANRFSLFWVTNTFVVSAPSGATETAIHVNVSAECFTHKSWETNWISYVPDEQTLIVVGSEETLSWFHESFQNVPTNLMREELAHQDAGAYFPKAADGLRENAQR